MGNAKIVKRYSPFYIGNSTNNLNDTNNNNKGEESEKELQKRQNLQTENEANGHKFKIVWINSIAFVYLHFALIYGFYLGFTGQTKLYTQLFTLAAGTIGSLGVTAGAHRLWSHKSYKANLPLRILLMFMQTLAFQNSIYEWSRDHRVHHKFVDTNADPHNINRGFFFAHMGWLMIKKHPDVKEKGKTIDMSDLETDPVVMFQHKYFVILMPLMAFVIPTIIPMYFWGETFTAAWHVAGATRYLISLHLTWCINSVTHTFGTRPYDKNLAATDNLMFGIIGTGEGWHNYHHVFPWDYKTSEMGKYHLNWTRTFIDFFASIGWAYDLKTVSDEMIHKRVLRTGDGSHRYSKLKTAAEKLNMYVNSIDHHEDSVWGWDDRDMKRADIEDANIINKSDYFYHVLTGKSKLLTQLIALVVEIIGSLGVTAGSHRLWSHKSYKANLPLKILLKLMQALAFQNSIYKWTRAHRVHYKFVDNNADPHNINRGFFFAHMGWLMIKKHPDVKEKGKTIDMSDLETDPVVMFQHNYFMILMGLPHLTAGCPILTVSNEMIQKRVMRTEDGSHRYSKPQQKN